MPQTDLVIDRKLFHDPPIAAQVVRHDHHDPQLLDQWRAAGGYRHRVFLVRFRYGDRHIGPEVDRRVDVSGRVSS